MLDTKKRFNFLIAIFKDCLLWNISETVIYQILLVGHQIALFYALPKDLFGLQASLFATLFFSVTVLDGALDLSFIPFFKNFTSSKKTFKKTVLLLLIFQFFILCIGSFTFLYFLPKKFESSLILLCTFLIISEGMKKNVRSFLQVALFYKNTAAIEMCNIIVYVTSIWTYYLYYKTLPLYLIISSFLFVSVITNILLYKTLYNYYQTLLPNNNDIEEISLKNYAKTRFFLYTNQLTRIFFSSNFFIPYIAFRSNFEKISSLSLLHTITFTSQSILQKIFGPTAAALFTFANKEDTFETKKKLFLFIQKLFLYVVAGCIIGTFLYIPFIKIIDPSSDHYTMLFFITFFTIFHILETSFLVYEKFLMSAGKIYVITFFNTISSVIGVTICLQKLPLVTTLFLLCITRLLVTLCMSIITKRKYAITFYSAIEYIITAALIIISLLYFIAHTHIYL